MTNLPDRRSLVLLSALLAGGSCLAAEEVPLAKDLTAVIALLGLPCGEVVAVVRLGENDHLATCRDGQRYRVGLDASGRVVAQRQ